MDPFAVLGGNFSLTFAVIFGLADPASPIYLNRGGVTGFTILKFKTGGLHLILLFSLAPLRPWSCLADMLVFFFPGTTQAPNRVWP